MIKCDFCAYSRYVDGKVVCKGGREGGGGYCDDNLRCPFCGYENNDSFELSDEDDEYICPQCGSTLKYHREIKVSYDVEVVEEKEPLEVEFKDQENENEQETQN